MKYENPSLEIIEVKETDVIMTSDPVVGDPFGILDEKEDGNI